MYKDIKKKRATYKRWYDKHKAEYNKERSEEYKKNPKLAWRQRLNVVKRRYGLSKDQYESMIVAQSGRCAMCGGDNNGKLLSVDHCHKTGAVRSLLCTRCNLGLGYIEDNEFVVRAHSYLTQHNF